MRAMRRALSSPVLANRVSVRILSLLCAILLALAGIAPAAFGHAGPPTRRAAIVITRRAVPTHERLACIDGDTEIDPCGGSVSAPPNSANQTVTYDISNASVFEADYQLTCSYTAPVTSCSVPSEVTVQGGDFGEVTLTYSTGSSGTGSVTISAQDTYSLGNHEQADATTTVTVTAPTYTVAVTPDGQAVSADANSTSNTYAFTVKNNGSGDATYALTCSNTMGSCSLPGGSSVFVSHGGATKSVSVTYQAGAAGTQGTVKLTASYGSYSDAGSIVATAYSHTVTVTPDNGTQTIEANTSNSTSFTIKNVGTGYTSYSLTPTCSGTASGCTVSPTTANLAASASTTATVSYSTGGDETTGSVQLTARYSSTVSDAGSVAVTALASCEGPYSTMSPCLAGTVATVTTNATGKTVTSFTVKNEFGTGPLNYTFTCTPGGALTSCTPAPTSTSIAVGQSAIVAVKVNAGSSEGTGTVHLLSQTTANDQVAGDATVDVLSPTSVVVTANATRLRVDAGDTASHTFVVKNQGSLGATYALASVCSGAAQFCWPAPDTVTLNSKDSAVVVVHFSGDWLDSTGTVGLKATNAADSGITATATIPVTINRYGVAVTPASDSTTVATGSPQSYSFTVINTGNTTTTYTLTTPCISPVTGCSSVGSIQIDSGAAKTVSVNYTASVASLSGGVIRLRAAHGTSSIVADTGVVRVAAHSPAVGGEPQVALANSDSLATRDRCLTIAAGPSAAYECGDLRLVHALPSIRTMSKTRTPTLLYDSRFAEPHPLVAADVTLLADTVAPQTINAVVTIDGTQTTASWSGSGWVPGTTRRLVVPIDGTALTTGVHSYQFQVFNVYSSTVQRPSPILTGRFVVVNRAASHFGAGWWLAGLEYLDVAPSDTTTRLWVGGDGSVRLYEKVASGVWAAPAVNRPDTLTWDGTSYVRHASHGVQVVFDGQGHHIKTIDRLGFQTIFTYAADTLKTIAVPPNGSGKTYYFAYPSTGQVTITAPPLGDTARVATLLLTNGHVTTIRDPDYQLAAHPYVSFGYDGTSGRIKTRTDKRGTTVTYSYDAGQALHTVSIPLNQSETAVTTITAAESQGVSPAIVRADSVFTLLDGPRLDVPDTTHFWIDRFGEPWKIHDALGLQTLLSRADPDYPALVTRLQQPNGNVVLATYDARGNVATVTDSALFGDSRSATTSYQWDPKWDFVDSIVTPTGLTTTMAYNTTNGNRLWQQTGPDATRRVNFAYWTTGAAAGLLQSVILPGSVADTTAYDALGNPSSYRTPRGFVTQYFNDAIGRTYETRQQVDASGTTRMLRVTMSYDVMSRDTMTVTSGLAAGDPVAGVRRTLNLAGNDSLITRWTTPDTAKLGNPVTRIFRDAIGRVVKQVAPDGFADSTVYDAAGNVVTTFNRNGDSVVFAYDALNRLRRRSTAAKHFGTEIIGLARGQLYSPDKVESVEPGVGLSQSYPWARPGGYDIPAAVDTFVYSPTDGTLTDANNAAASVHFTYYPNGLLHTEQNSVAQWASCTPPNCPAPHVYTTTKTYDLDGRLSTLTYPSAIAPAESSSVSYHYSPYGDLSYVTDFDNNNTNYTVNARGELVEKQFPGDFAENFTYDNDGNPASDTLRYQGSTVLRAEAFTYDARGNRLGMSGTSAGSSISDSYSYDVLGQLASSSNAMEQFSATTTNALDGMGNIAERSGAEASITWVNDDPAKETTSDNGEEWSFYIPGTGRLWYTKNVPNADTTGTLPGGGGRPAMMNRYDSAGNLIWTGSAILRLDATNFATAQSERRMYYGPDGKLRAVEMRALYKSANAPDNSTSRGYARSFEEYRYDALGRRVATRTDQGCDDGVEYNESNAPCHVSGLRRTIWDGSRELGEIQVPLEQAENDTYAGQGSSTTYNLAPFYGAVAYIYDGVVDQPLAVTRLRYSNLTSTNSIVTLPPFTFYPVWDIHGVEPDIVGAPPPATECPSSTPGGTKGTCLFLVRTQQWLPYRDVSNIWQKAWQGSLLEDKVGAGGLMYRRHRYYDSKSGRFTQEDPMGLAGGLNLYGFAAGDPVNYSDPFGLRVQIGCRPITGSLGAEYSHCAIRIDDSYGHHYSFELMPVTIKGKPHSWNTIQAVPDESEYTWTTVSAPKDMTDKEWDSTVRAAAEVVGYDMNGKRYHADGAHNSNHYVYRAITLAGGEVPESATPKDGRVAPGLCGGSVANTGKCKP